MDAIKNWFLYQRRLLVRYKERRRWAVFWVVLSVIMLFCGALGTATAEDYIDKEIVTNLDYYYHDDMQLYMDAENYTQLPLDIMASANKDYLSDFESDAIGGYDQDTEDEIAEGLLDFFND